MLHLLYGLPLLLSSLVAPYPDGSAHTTTVKHTGNGVGWTTQAIRTGTLTNGQLVRFAFKLSQTSTSVMLGLETPDGLYNIGVHEDGGALYLRLKLNSLYLNAAKLLDGVAVN